MTDEQKAEAFLTNNMKSIRDMMDEILFDPGQDFSSIGFISLDALKEQYPTFFMEDSHANT